MKALVLIGDRPDPPISGVRVRNFHLWKSVAEAGVEVRVLGLDFDEGRPGPARMPGGIEAEFLRPTRRPAHVRAAAGFFLPYHMNPFVEGLARRVDEVIGEWRPDVVHAEEMRMARYLPGVRGRDARAAQTVTFHNVESDLFAAIGRSTSPVARRLSTRLQIGNLRRFEARVSRSIDLGFAYSAIDLARYRARLPGPRWEETRNGSDVRGVAPSPEPSEPSALFVGSLFYGPNLQGLAWFLDEVRPKLPPGTRITVAGSGAGEAIRARLREAGVTFLDTPIDLAPVYASHSVVVVPVLEGSGTRGKILEALAHGRAVVTTTKGPEGLELAPGEGIVVADGAEAFANAVAEVMISPESRAEIARRGRDAVMARYDWSVVASGLVDAWTRCISR